MRVLPSRFLRVAALALVAIAAPASSLPAAELPPGLYAEVTTPRGVVTAELFHERAPLTVTSFVGLAEGTLGPEPRRPFFDGLTFHRVVPGFVVQGGDPTGTGEGGPGYEFPDEFAADLSHDAVGILSMANAGPDTNGSQWVFTLAPVRRLDWLHSVFGRVVAGLEVLPRIQQGDTMQVRIVRVGPAAGAFRADEERLAALIAAAPKAVLPHFDDPEGLLPAEPPRARILDHKLANLQRFTGARLFARVFKQRDPADADARPGAIARRWATKVGAAQTGITALYFADRAEWAFWIGDDVLPRFTPAGTTAETPLHDRKATLIAAARERAAAIVARRAAEGVTMEPAAKLNLEVNEVVDALVALLAPPPERAATTASETAP